MPSTSADYFKKRVPEDFYETEEELGELPEGWEKGYKGSQVYFVECVLSFFLFFADFFPIAAMLPRRPPGSIPARPRPVRRTL